MAQQQLTPEQLAELKQLYGPGRIGTRGTMGRIGTGRFKSVTGPGAGTPTRSFAPVNVTGREGFPKKMLEQLMALGGPGVVPALSIPALGLGAIQIVNRNDRAIGPRLASYYLTKGLAMAGGNAFRKSIPTGAGQYIDVMGNNDALTRAMHMIEILKRRGSR